MVGNAVGVVECYGKGGLIGVMNGGEILVVMVENLVVMVVL